MQAESKIRTIAAEMQNIAVFFIYYIWTNQSEIGISYVSYYEATWHLDVKNWRKEMSKLLQANTKHLFL